MIVNQDQVLAALSYWGGHHGVTRGAPDKISLPRECAMLTDLLCSMWYSQEREAQIPHTHPIAGLIVQAHGIPTVTLATIDDPQARIEPAGGAWILGSVNSVASRVGSTPDAPREACQ